LALEASPPRIEAARLAIAEALRHDTVSPHLWFTRAQIEAEAGNGEGAIACVEEALELSPEYAPARRLYAELRNDTSGSAIAKP
jgi:tetratricopeptide (TPR) repeat protein